MTKITEMTKVNVHYHLGNERDPESGTYLHTADRTLNNYKTYIKKFNMSNAESDIQKAINLNYGIFSVTNSNVIHSKEIEELIHKYSKNICIIPGVEVNLKADKNPSNKYLHVVVLFDPHNINKIHEKSNQLELFIEKNSGKPFLNFDQFIDFVYDKDVKCVVAAHGIKQKERSCSNNPEVLSELIGLDNIIPILIEDNKKFHKEQLKVKLKDKLSMSNKDLIWLDESSSISSLDRNEVEELEDSDNIWGGKSFDDLFFAAIMGGHRILKYNDIVPRKNYIKTIQFNKSANTQINEGNIELSYGLNTIVGASGSGKTLLLEILYSKLTGNTLENKSISNKTDYKDIYNPSDIILLNENGEEITEYSNYKVYEGKNLYNEIITAYSEDDQELLKKFNLTVDNTDVENIIEEYFKDVDIEIVKRKTAKNKRSEIESEISRMASSLDYLISANVTEPTLNLAEIKEEGSTIETLKSYLESYKEDYKTFEDSFDNIKIIGEKYELSNSIIENIKQLEKIINEEMRFYELSNEIEMKQKQKNKLIESRISKVKEEYNASLGKRVQEYDSQSNTYKNSVTNIFGKIKDMIRNTINQVVPVIDRTALLDGIKIDNHDYFRLDKKIKTTMNLETLFLMLQSSVGNRPKINKSKFNSAFINLTIDLARKEDIQKLIDIYVEHEEEIIFDYAKNSHNLTSFDIEIKNVDGSFQSISKVTAGNLAKIYISYMFEKDIKKEGANILVLYDQPEANMEKRFIHEILSDKIKELRLTSQVILATHEPLLVVNADANQIILSENDKLLSNKNNISYENISFVGTKSKSEMIKDLANLIDGSPSAVSKRNKIYGGLISNESN